MSNNKYDIDGLIRYFEMAYKVMGWTNPEENSYEYHAAKMLKQLREERDEARRLLKAVVDMMRDNMAPDATHPKHVCDFIYCPEIATCMVCENWTDALVMCYPDDFQDEEETK